MEAALAALNILKPADITVVKSMNNPPAGVKLVMAAVCVMKDVRPDKINDPAGTGQKVSTHSIVFTQCNIDLLILCTFRDLICTAKGLIHRYITGIAFYVRVNLFMP